MPKPTQSHNYIQKAMAAIVAMKLPPRPHLLTIEHDAWCDMVNGRGFCNCNPTFHVRPLPSARDN